MVTRTTNHRLRQLALGTLLFAARVEAQAAAAPTMVMLGHIDDGVGGHLRLADGTGREFHLEVSGTRARLCPKRSPKGDDAGLAFDGSEEHELLSLLDAWVASAFDGEQRTAILAPERLPAPRREEQNDAHVRATLLRALHAYHRVTRPRIDKVFPGRGTVTLSMQLRLGDDAPRQILWRQLGEQPFARMHVGTDEEPVALDSRDEAHTLLAIRYWLAARLGKDDVWEVDAAKSADDARLVLTAFRGYLTATSPRLRSAGIVMDGAPGGSRVFRLSDARNRITDVRFDHAAGSATPGRLREENVPNRPLVELGSARERELLAMLRAAAALRRAFAREKQGIDTQRKLAEEELAAYEQQFPAKK